MIRKLALDEWFTLYQLKHIQKHHFHLSSVVEADISKIQASYQGQPFPLTFILIKAMALALKHEPRINRQVVHTFFGTRMREGEACSINVPVMMNFNGQSYLSATVIKEANTKTVQAIKEEIKIHLKKAPHELWLGKYVFGRKNHFLNRLRLKAIHFLINAFPSIQEQYGAGTASVSSLLNLKHEGTDMVMVGRGAGAFSVTASHFNAETGKLRLAVAWDHCTGTGMDGVNGGIALCRVLQDELSTGELYAGA